MCLGILWAGLWFGTSPTRTHSCGYSRLAGQLGTRLGRACWTSFSAKSFVLEEARPSFLAHTLGAASRGQHPEGTPRSPHLCFPPLLASPAKASHVAPPRAVSAGSHRGRDTGDVVHWCNNRPSISSPKETQEGHGDGRPDGLGQNRGPRPGFGARPVRRVELPAHTRSACAPVRWRTGLCVSVRRRGLLCGVHELSLPRQLGGPHRTDQGNSSRMVRVKAPPRRLHTGQTPGQTTKRGCGS